MDAACRREEIRQSRRRRRVTLGRDMILVVEMGEGDERCRRREEEEVIEVWHETVVKYVCPMVRRGLSSSPE
jgi:hypothetical protein